MNKYTLTFLNNSVEKDYQKQKPSLLRQVITINILCLLYLLYMTIDNELKVVQNDFVIGVVKIVFFSFLLLNCLVFIKRNHFKHCFFIGNIILMFLQFDAKSDSTPQQLFNYGNNLMAIHALIIHISDFTQGAIQIIMHLIITILIASFSADSNNISWPLYLAGTIPLHFVWVWVHYAWTKAQRSSYLLSIQQTQFETIIPKLMVQDFCLFTYDPDQFKYDIKLSNMFKTTQDFVDYIRRLLVYKSQGQTLEQYLLKNKTRYSNFLALDQKKLINIEFDELYSNGRTYFLRFIQPTDIEVKEQVLQKQNAYIRYLIQIIQSQLNISFGLLYFQKFKISAQKSLIAKNVIYLLSNLIKMNETNLRNSSHHAITKRLVRLYNFSHQKSYIKYKSEDIRCRSLPNFERNTYISILIELLNALDKTRKYNIILSTQNDHVILRIDALLDYKKLQILSQKSKLVAIQIYETCTEVSFYFDSQFFI